MLFIPQLFTKFNANVAAVNCLVEIKQVYLEQGTSATHCWPNSHIRDPWQRHFCQAVDVNSVNAHHWGQMTMQMNIGGWKTKLPTQLITQAHPAHHRITAT